MTKPKTVKADPAPAQDVVPARDEKGRFPAGVSGNPAGRAKGAKNRITLERLLLEEQLRTALSEKGPEILKKAVKMALDGNDKVMRVLLDKMLATPKGDDSEGAADRDIKVIVQNLTTTSPESRPPIEGAVIRTQITKESPQ